MSLLSRFFRSSGDALTGTWRQTGAPQSTEMIFHADGRLEYRILEGSVLQIMKLTYRVEGDEIVSDQPSSPREERTNFRFEGSNVLILTHGGEESRYERDDG
jgi:hypothetical protein